MHTHAILEPVTRVGVGSNEGLDFVHVPARLRRSRDERASRVSPAGTSPEEFTAMIQREIAMLTKLVKAANVKLN
jgi:hypothetical protein